MNNVLGRLVGNKIDGGNGVSIIQSRRITRSLLLLNNEPFKFKIVMACSPFMADALISDVNKAAFPSMERLEKYLSYKKVELIKNGKDLTPKYKYNNTAKHLHLETDIPASHIIGDLSLIIVEAFDTFYLFDIKDNNVDKLHESDGFEFNYHI